MLNLSLRYVSDRRQIITALTARKEPPRHRPKRKVGGNMERTFTEFGRGQIVRLLEDGRVVVKLDGGEVVTLYAYQVATYKAETRNARRNVRSVPREHVET